MSARSAVLGPSEGEGSSSEDEEEDDGSSDGERYTGSSNKILRRSGGLSALKTKAKNANSMRKLCEKHVLVAVSVGFWVAVFGLPLYCIKLNYWIFGQRGDLASALNATGIQNLSDAEDKMTLTCASTDTGEKRNVAPPGVYPKLVDWNESMSAWDDEQNSTDLWCGFAPSAYLDYWPNAAQLIVFTVYKNTGTTISFAWQGIAGTLLATMNIHLMTWIFPEGAAGHVCVGSTGSDKYYVIMWKSDGKGWTRRTATSETTAQQNYLDSDSGGGLLARAIFFPGGALDEEHAWFADAEDELEAKAMNSDMLQEDCEPGTIVHKDPNYGNYGVFVCMLDVFLVIFLFLFSTASRNAVMFGMSWHTIWMMNFMNPEKGVTVMGGEMHWWNWALTEYFVVEATTVVGGIVAIVATLVPCAKLQNLTNLYDEALSVNLAIVRIWTDALNYLAGNERSAVRLQIETQIEGFEGTTSEVRENIQGAWWETFLWGRWGRQLRLLKSFVRQAVDIKDLLYVVKSCVISEDFAGSSCNQDGHADCDEHSHFWAKMRPTAEDLASTTSDLTWALLNTFQDGDISTQEFQYIERHLRMVKDSQVALTEAFSEAAPPMSESLAEEQTFVFALACWSRKCSDFAEHTLESASSGKLHERRGMLRVMFDGVYGLFNPAEVLKHQHLKYAARNWVSICLCFLVGYYVEGSIFTRYNYVLAMTLTLLFVPEGAHVIEYEKCAHRLLGVFLGKAMPLVINSLIGLIPCDLRLLGMCCQILAVWAYVTTFCFLYYNSDKWSYVSCLIGGFGIYGLLTPRCQEMTQEQSNAVFVSKYQEIGNVTVAIFIQALTHSVLSRRSAQMLFSKRLRGFGDAVLGGVQAMFRGDVAGMASATKVASAQLAMAKAVAPECDPKLKLHRGSTIPLQMDVCTRLLSYSELLLGELSMIVTVTEDWVPNRAVLREYSEVGDDGGGGGAQGEGDEEPSCGILEMLGRCPQMKQAEQQLLPSMSVLSEVVPSMMGTEEKEAWEHDLRRPEDVRAHGLPQGVPGALYAELSARVRGVAARSRSRPEDITNDIHVRLTIAVWSLQNLAYHVGKIEELCMKEAMRQA